MGSGTITTSSDIDLITVNESGTLELENDETSFIGTLSHTSTTYNKSVINNSGVVKGSKTTVKIIGDYRGIYNAGTLNLRSVYTNFSIETTRGEAIYSVSGYVYIGSPGQGNHNYPYIHSYNNYAIKMEASAWVHIYSGTVESDAMEAIYGSGYLKIGETFYGGGTGDSYPPYIKTNSYSHQAINSKYLKQFELKSGRLYSPAIDGTNRGYIGKAPTLPNGYSLIGMVNQNGRTEYVYVEFA